MARKNQKLASTTQKIEVTKPDGKVLQGLLHEAGSTNVHVLCHGYRSNKNGKTIKIIARAMEEKGFSTVRFDFSGNGKKDGDEFKYSNYWGEVEDLRAVIIHFTKKGRKISAILGHSKGANVVLLYASKYHDIPKVVNVSGRFDLKEGIEERLGVGYMEILRRDGRINVEEEDKNGNVKDYWVTLPCVEERKNLDMKEECSKIDKQCRVLTIHGSEDTLVLKEDANLFHAAVRNHTTKFIEGADHCYTGKKDQLTSAILSFLKDVQ